MALSFLDSVTKSAHISRAENSQNGWLYSKHSWHQGKKSRQNA